MRILHLTLKKKWFDMIASGEKPEEYREIKLYWNIRLLENFYGIMPANPEFQMFDAVHFKNGYSKQAPEMAFEFLGITIGEGKPEWGAKAGEQYYIIQLGEKITL